MLHRPSKAVMAPIAEAVGTLAGTLAQPFISRDVGYVQDDPGQKSRKVRNHMLKSPFKSVIARAATFALVLSLAIAFATVGLAPSASAQQADGPSCEANSAGTMVTCSYDENDDVPVADFAAMDPEGQGVDWDLNGDDAGKFTIDGGVLEFKDSPNYEDPKNPSKSFTVIVRATEILGADEPGPANSTQVTVTVNINNVDEPGKVTFDYLQPQEGVPWMGTLKDGDDPEVEGSWEWSVPRVSRPEIDNDRHWIKATGTASTDSYTPLKTVKAVEADPDASPAVEAVTGDAGKRLRAKVTYSDIHGDDKVVYAVTDVPVRLTPDESKETNKAPRFEDADNKRNVNENAKVGTHVGSPVTATVDEDLNLLTYRLVDSLGTSTADPDDYEGPFSIDPKTGQIKVKAALVNADRAVAATTDTGSPSYDSPTETWTYTLYVLARDPFGLENDDEDVTDSDTSADPDEDDAREEAFAVTVTVKEVNEKPKVRQASVVADNVAQPAISAGGVVANEISKVCIEENSQLVDKDGDPDTAGNQPVFSNVVTNNNDCTAMAMGYTFTADDDDIAAATATGQVAAGDDTDPTLVIDGRATAGQVKLSLSGDDAARFELVETETTAADGDTNRNRYELRFKSDPNFEAPMDANKDNRYEVSVMATDENGLAGMKDLTVRVINAKENGKVKLSTTQPAVGFPVTATLTDPDTGETGMKWQWQSSADGTYFFDISGATSDTYTPKGATEDNPATALIDEEDPGDEGLYLRAMVTYRDDALADADDDVAAEADSVNAVRVEPGVNADPVFEAGITREVAENTKEGGTVGGPVRATDPDDDVLTYTLTGGADMGSFKMSNDGQITVGKGTKLDYEGGQRTYVVEVTATDPFGAMASAMVTIMVTDVNEKPRLTMDEPSCEANSAGTVFTCSYDENDDVAVADFAAMDPEGQGVDWDLNGDDAGKFTIDGGVLEFKDSPNYEDTKNPSRTFTVIVRATEILGADEPGPANSTQVTVTVNINNVDEPGKVTFDYLQPQEGVPWMGTLKDGDDPEVEGSWEWSVPRVSRPEIDNDRHWIKATGTASTNSYTPLETEKAVEADADANPPVVAVTGVTGDAGKRLRAKVTYSDIHGDDKVVYAVTDVPVRLTPDESKETNKAPRFEDADNKRNVNENAKVGTHVGSPVTATVDEDLNLLTYRLVDSLGTSTADPDDYEGPFSIDPKTGQIKVKAALVNADRAVAATTDTGSPSYDSPTETWTYTLYVLARDPFGLENDDEDVTDSDTSADPDEDDAREEAFAVTVTVKEVNEKPKVRQASVVADNVAQPAISAGGVVANEISKVCIEENSQLVDKDGDPDTAGNQPVFSNVVTNNNDCTAMAMGYTFTADDDDIAAATATGQVAAGDDTDPTLVIDGRATAGQVKLSLSGDDAARFELVETETTAADGDTNRNRYELRFKSDPNFEAPMDANKDNRYEVSVMATDENGLAGMKDLTVRVINAKENGKVKLSTTQPAVGFPVTATLTDPDTGETGMKWQWQSSADGTYFFDISGATSDTYTPKGATEDNPATALIDEEDPGDEGLYLRAMVTYRDDALADADDDVAAEADSVNAVRVEPGVNADPVFEAGITREVAENTKEGGTVGGPVRATDPDDDVLTYTLTGGADMGSFKMSNDGQITVGKGTKLDYEGGQRTYVVEVTATDPFDASDSTMVTITVTDVNEGPTLTLGGGSTPPSAGVVGGREYVSYRENGIGDVGTYTTTIDSPTWELSGADAGDFTINGGVLSFSSSPDYEAPTDANTDNVYMVTVMANNGNGGATLDVTVTVTNDPSDDATNGAFDPLSYDADDSGAIERPEVIQAIRDYFDDMIDRDDVILVIRAYFGNGS